MNGFLRRPRLPEGSVSLVLISGEYPWLKDALKRQEIQSITTTADFRLPEPVRFHPDLQVCPFLFEQMFVLKENILADSLTALGFHVTQTITQPTPRYPGDVLCGGFLWGEHFVGNPKGIDKAIQEAAHDIGLKPLWVRQGYGACSTVLVDEHSAITADQGMARRLMDNGFEVLVIRPGHIQLPGYDTGFLGGCCGKLAPNELAFTGELSSHPDGERIKSFLVKQGIKAIELIKGPLVDVGGILPLLEKH